MTLERPSNIDLFNDITALVLAELYKRFPISSEVDEMAIAAKVSEGVLLGDNDAEEMVDETIKWLVLSGYIHEDKQGFMVLTAKGLEVLKSTPDSLDKSLGDRLKTAGTGASRHLGREVVNQALALGVKYWFGGQA